MVRRGPCILLTFICVLAVASSASAECAWVLWLNVVDRGSGLDTHDIDSGHSTRQECGAAAESMAAVLKKNGFDAKGGFRGSYEAIGVKGTKNWKYYCLPDTVDPRGPKGMK